MSCSTGKNITVTVFGQSHSQAIGSVTDGVPAGIHIDENRIAEFMKRRSAYGELSTARHEPDTVKIISGIVDGVTCGTPICGIIENRDAVSGDYDELKYTPRPSHADFAAYMKHKGFNDFHGGGNSSGRMTAALCFAGAVCIQLLETKNIYIGAHIKEIHGVYDESFDPVNVSRADFEAVRSNGFPVLNASAGEKMKAVIADAKENNNSVGGIIECAVTGLEAGTGEPIFDGIENKISSVVFGIPSVKGIEFGSGFDACKKYGSENNDDFTVENGEIKTVKNDHGGSLGGMASGMPVIFRCVTKPVPSIGLTQQSVNLKTNEVCEINIGGRHDPCIAPRAVVCVEAAAAIAVADMVFGR